MEGEYDAIVLAHAGLSRLGVLVNWSSSEYRDLAVSHFNLEALLPAPGQAVIVAETRVDDEATDGSVSPLDHPPTRLCADAERAFLRAFGGGCSVPVAAYATVEGEMLELKGLVASPDGGTVLRDTEEGPSDRGLDIAHTLAARLGERGAFQLFVGRVPDSEEATV
jgi:hydroxymethylbilane synthase